jgi:hypothetical protein
MKKILIILALLSPFSLFCQQSVFTYVEGEVSIKRASGELIDAFIDDKLNLGDSIITGADGFAELNLENSSTITIDSDTVFIFSRKEKQGEKKSIFMVVLGKIKFKFDRLLNEPDIQTPATVAGIRGTEFTVVSALDGSALYVVDEGSVEVEAQGSVVVLNTEEGVKVPVGNKPGEKFEVKIGKVDFSGWLDEGNNQFEKDPAGTLAGVTERLIGFAEEAETFYNSFEESFTELKGLEVELASIGIENDSEKKEFYDKNIIPKKHITSNYVLNYRYYALSALSLRQYVLSSMYIDMKTKYIVDNENELYKKFIQEYYIFLKIYEEKVTPYLVDADI